MNIGNLLKGLVVVGIMIVMLSSCTTKRVASVNEVVHQICDTIDTERKTAIEAAIEIAFERLREEFNLSSAEQE